MKQARLFPKQASNYGGNLRRRIRHARPLPSRGTLHLTLKSTQAKGAWAFNTRRNRPIVERLVRKFADRFGVDIFSVGNAGNHVHLHLRPTNRLLYRAFIRALSSALATAITGHSRWNKVLPKPFFNHRPHSRVVAQGLRAFQAVKNYTLINSLEGRGLGRRRAERLVREHLTYFNGRAAKLATTFTAVRMASSERRGVSTRPSNNPKSASR